MTRCSPSAIIQDFTASEDIINNTICVLDVPTQTIHQMKSIDDWNKQGLLVLVYQANTMEGTIIKAGTKCRCWKVWVQF